MGKILRMFFVLIFFAVIVLAGVFYLAIFSWRSPSKTEVNIPRGSSVTSIASTLHEAGVIKTPILFKLYVKLTGSDSNLHAGTYEFSAGIAMNEVLDKLCKGETKKYSITIIEGWTIKDIAHAITEKPFLADSDVPQEFVRLAHDKKFIKSLNVGEVESLEGYLFPDTYKVSYPLHAADLIKSMVTRFKDVWAVVSAGKELHGMTRAQIVTLASIVEKETAKPDERPIVAGVMINRLKKGILLQSDPTVIYGIPHFNGNITKEDLRNPHPYNTYIHKGLPPGPICNPGRAALEAAISPADTDYLYFVSKNDGSHYFSKTLSEHLRAVRRYQLIGGR